MRTGKLDADAEAPAHPVPESGEEAVRGLHTRRDLVGGHRPDMLNRQQTPAIDHPTIDEQPQESVVVTYGRHQLGMVDVEGGWPGIEAPAGRLGLDQSGVVEPIGRR